MPRRGRAPPRALQTHGWNLVERLVLFCGGLGFLEVRACPAVGRWPEAGAGRASRESPQAQRAAFRSLKPPLNAESHAGLFCGFTEGRTEQNWGNRIGRRTEFGEDSSKRSWQRLGGSNLDVLRGKCYSLLGNAPWKG